MAAGGQSSTPPPTKSCLKHGRGRLLSFFFVQFIALVLSTYNNVPYDYQMAFSPFCSAIYALGLMRLISRCYAEPQCSTHPNRCLLVPGLSIPFGFPFVLACPVLALIALFYWSSLCSCRATMHIPFSYTYSVFVMLSGFLPHQQY